MTVSVIPAPCKDGDNHGMSPHEIRRDNLRRLTDQLGGVAALAHRIERDQSQVSRWLAWPTPNSRAISTKMATHIEHALGLTMGWLSTLHADKLPEHPLINAACQYLNTSPDPAIADILAQLLEALTPPR
ncbi:hypothetical protein NK214_06525 [Chromobacterium sp. S0633]|nr:hypothetical protein [Chromobacterium sp. S0633]